MDNASFSINDACIGNVTQAIITGVQGGSFSITPNANGESISSTGAITNGIAGTSYTITYTTPSGGCQKNTTDNVTLFSLPATPVVNLVNDTLRTISNSSSYLWYLNGTSTGTTTSYYVPGVVNGNYQVQITNTNGCSSTSSTFSYQFTGITNVGLNTQLIKIYPNPASNKLFIDLDTLVSDKTI